MIDFLRRNKILLLLCGINFLFCLIYLFFFCDPFYVPGHEYTDIARNIAAGRGYIGSGFFHLKYAPTAFLTPGYSYFLGLLIKIFGLPQSFLVARIFNALVNSLILLAIYFLTVEIFGQRVALLSSLLFTFYLPFIGWTYEVWDTLVFTLVLLFLVLLTLKSTNPFIIGILIGIGSLVNSLILLYLPIAVVYLMFRRKISFLQLLSIILFCFLVISPWAMRNYRVFGAFVPLRTGLWFNLYLGNNSDATGTVYLKHQGSVPADFKDGITYHFRPMIPELVKMNEYEQDQFFKKKFFDYVRNDFNSFCRLFLKKIYYYLWFNPFEKLNILWALEYLFILIFSSIGFLQALLERKRIMVFLMLILSFVLVYALTGPFFNWKYRIPIEPYLIILAGFGLENVSFCVMGYIKETL